MDDAPHARGPACFDDLGTDPKQVADVYDAWGQAYDEDIRVWGYDAPERATDLLVAIIDDETTEIKKMGTVRGTVLDVACGTGLQAKSLRENGFGPIYGIDISKELVKAAIASGRYNDVQIGDLNNPLPYDDNSFNHAMCIGSLTYVDLTKLPNTFDELCRIVKPNGKVIFTCRSDRNEQCECVASAMNKWKLLRKLGPLPYLPKHPAFASKKVEMFLYAYVVNE
mmetsp:Transcript_7413/g.16808  ORF Transcript_7413/g.16808 Transcript_7413/m.16808 type:complete len:225 (-) Transcript_7413:97-771(-)